MRDNGFRRSFSRNWFRTDSEDGMSDADAVDRWEYASALGDANIARRKMADERPEEYAQLVETEARAKALRAPPNPERVTRELAEARADSDPDSSVYAPRRRKRLSWKRSSNPVDTLDPSAWR
jgi:hypothetical protein